MRDNTIYYCEPVFRPPSEAYSLLIQATEGCTFHCTFCISNLEKQFRVRPIDDIKVDLQKAVRIYGDRVQRIFFLDGNAFVMKPEMLIELGNYCRSLFPRLERVSAYAHAKDILRKSEAELKQIAEAGITMVYLGIETGDDDILTQIKKQTTAAELAEASQKLHRGGITLSGTIILGIAGGDPSASQKHAIATGKLINKMAPLNGEPWYISALTLMLAPGSELTTAAKNGKFRVATSHEALVELKTIIETISPDIKNCIFRCNHASNYLPLKGVLAEDRSKLLETIQWGIDHPQQLRPEWYRGL
jgi:radical SAM superfamily enzyme YgiQ (UPF0313 family)